MCSRRLIRGLDMSVASPQAYEQLSPSRNWQHSVQVLAKRAFDIVVSSLLLIVLAPVFVTLAILVKITSRGPVLYAWKVAGKGGRPFTGYKFRSMVANADDLKASLAERNEMTGPMFKIADDPRITRVGRWMRRYSLDELPQIYSVLTGEMSLVGPRPPLVTEYEQFSEYHRQKLAVTPGMTCLWQVSGRNRISDFDQWVALDLEYIRDWSLTLDFKILWRTAIAVVTGSGK